MEIGDRKIYGCWESRMKGRKELDGGIGKCLKVWGKLRRERLKHTLLTHDKNICESVLKGWQRTWYRNMKD